MTKDNIIYAAQMQQKTKEPYATRLRPETIDEIKEIQEILTALAETKKVVPASAVVEIAIAEMLKAVKEK